MSNFIGSTKTAALEIFASEVNDDRKDVVINAGDYNTSGGSSNAYTLSLDAQITALVEGMVVKFKANHANTGASTININSIGANTIKKADGTDLIAGDLIVNGIYFLIYNGTNFILLSPILNGSNIRVFTAGGTINGATLPVPVYLDSSTNKVLACDANDTTKLDFLGFAVSNSTDTNPINVAVSGVVGGFTGLTLGADYYVSDTVGTISTTPGTYQVITGKAIKTTEVLIAQPEDVPRLYLTATSPASLTDTSPASTQKVGSFVFSTVKKARLIKLDITLFPNMTGSGNGSTARTYYECWVDVAQAFPLYTQNTRTTYNSGLSPYIELLDSGGTNAWYPVAKTAGGFPLSYTASGSTCRIDSIVATNNTLTINYTLNVSGAGGQATGIALSPVLIL